MNEKLTIDVDGNQFVIHCPFWANELVRNMPTRKWNKSKRAWVGPVIRANVAHIEQLATMAGVVLSDNAREALRHHADTIAGMGVRGVGFPSWYQFKRQPRKHQREALDKGYGKKAFALFMDMQTGKSKTAIDMAAAHRMEGHIQAVLIITKKTLRLNWLNALNDDCTIPFLAHLPDTGTTGEKAFKRFLGTKHDFKIMIIGWESLSVGRAAGMCEEFLLSHHPTAIIADETNYITGHKAARTETTIKFGRMAEYRYALTGTPATEGPMNLFTQFEYLDPEIIGIGDFYAYRNRYATMGGYIPKEGPARGKPVQIVGYQNIDELMELIAPNSFQVMKSDAYDLPPKRYQLRTVQMTKEQKDAYAKVKKDGIIAMGGSDEVYTIQNTLEVALRLHQIAGGYSVTAREEHGFDAKGNPRVKMAYDPITVVPPDLNPKLIELVSVVEEAKGKQGLVWAVYMPEIRAIVKIMRGMGLRIGELHGGVPEADRQPMVDAFKRGELDWIVGNASTGGMGYSMHTAEVSIFYNNTFKLRDRLQAEDRCWGDGQTRPGIWVDIVAEKTVDVTVSKALAQKLDLHEYIRSRIKEVTALLDGD
jgi:SNF2 family DNA or RNA helicase